MHEPASDPSPTLRWEGRHLRIVDDQGWEYVQRKRCHGIVAIVAVTPERELLLVEQYRPPLRRRVIEIPAGLAGDLQDQPDEALEQAARRELLEETGWQANQLQAVFEGPVSAGLSDEVVTFFIASEMTLAGPALGDGDEQITVHAIALSNIHAWLDEQHAQGKAVDCKVYTALELCRRYQPGPIA